MAEDSPMLVHCSAGVGRTGTFIGLWNTMEALDRGEVESINTFQTVMDMRKERCLMVIYSFLYLLNVDNVSIILKCVLGAN